MKNTIMETRRRYRKPWYIAGIILIMSYILFGCQKTPETEYIVNKEGQNSLISQNSTVDSGVPLREQLHIPETIQCTGKALNEYTSIEIDAKVQVPEMSCIPIYSVRPVEMTEERVEDIATAFFRDGEIHSKEFGETIRTKEDIYEELDTLTQGWENEKAYVATEEVSDQDAYIVLEKGSQLITLTKEEYLVYREQEVEERTQELQAELLTAPDEKVYDATPHYGFTQMTDPITYDMTEDMEKKRMDYHYEVCDLVGLHEGKQYEMTVQKDDVFVLLRFESMEESEEDWKGYSWSDIYCRSDYFTGTGKNECGYSLEEAVEMGNELLEEIGFPDLKYQAGMDINAYTWNNEGYEEGLGRVGYKLYYYRTYDKMGDSYFERITPAHNVLGESTHLTSDNEMMADYISRYIYYNSNEQLMEHCGNRELAVIYVTDQGITKADIINPMENQELLAESVELLDFDRVVNQGMMQMEVLFGEAGTSYEKRRTLKVGSIEMHYARMQSPDNPDEYTMIPVWDFKTSTLGKNVISINAIDGTVYDRTSGY